MKRSFTLIEIILVLIIFGIFATTITFKIGVNRLDVAADRIIKDILYTESLAFNEDKYQPFPINSSSKETNRSKYWFKSWWQVRFFKNSNGDYFYEVFSDSPSFDKRGGPVSEFAIDTLTKKYLTGNYSSNTDDDLNLTHYGVHYITTSKGAIASNKSFRLLFDNYGNLFLDEGKKGDGGDINPLQREIMVSNQYIKLCVDSSSCNSDDKTKCIKINITPTGKLYKSKCNI